MAQDSDEERIRRKAHELWEADGRRHGRDQDHWTEAREIIAIEDSQAATLLPRTTGAEEPVEDADEALRNMADFPNLTDQGENLLTSTDREPSFAGGGEMPSVEVPTSDQPGIPAKGSKSSPKPAADMKASPKNDAPPPGKAEGGKKAAAAPKKATPPEPPSKAPSASKASPAGKAPPPKSKGK